MDDCIFCKIIRKEEHGHFVFEDDAVVGFLDSHPLNRGHTLVVTKNHYGTISDVPDAVLSRLIIATRDIGNRVCGALDAAGFNLFQNNGSHAGQVVPHIHFHIIPRFEQDPLRYRPERRQAEHDELSEIKDRILSSSGRASQ